MLLRRQVSEERDEHIDMTPMVDVVFQLMTFMLFSMQMTNGDVVKVPEARHGVGVDENAATVLLLAPPSTPGGKPRIFVGWKPSPVDRSRRHDPVEMTGDQQQVSVEQAVAAVSKGVAEGRRKVVVQADGSVVHGEVVALIGEIARKETGVTIHVGVQEPQ
jgi:biopolymer transport protein ExbD